MFKCDLCVFTCVERKSYVAHIKHFHNIPGYLPEFVCPFEVCNRRRYGNVNSFNSHTVLHEKRTTISEIENESENRTIIEQMPEYLNPSLSKISEVHSDSEKSVPDIVQTLQSGFQNLALKMYADESLPRNKTQWILNECQLLVQHMCSDLKAHCETCDLSKISEVFEELSQTTFVQTEYMFKKTLQTDDKTVPVIHYVLSESTSETQFTENIQIKKNSRFFKLVDLKTLFQKLFELPNFLDEIHKYHADIDHETTTISNVIQTPLWKSKINGLQSDTNTLLLPINIYFDDFEPLNALGSHSGAHKIGGVYCTIPSFPAQAQSMLKYIFLGSLFFTDDRKDLGNDKIFLPLIELLNKLQTEGINVAFGPYNCIKLIPFAIVGDNLGLNSMLGFVESFNSFHYCRFCNSHKRDMSNNIVEDERTVRTKVNYEIDHKLDNVSMTAV